MKQLTCEMCGSTDLVKSEGVFVCHTCGCKYSIEEAKKMMVEGTVDVSGSTVKIDTSAKLKNLYVLARRAQETMDFKTAAKYYREIKLEDPNSWEAEFYSVCFTAINSCELSQIDGAAQSLVTSLEITFQMIQENVPLEEQNTAYKKCVEYAALAITTLFNAAKDQYGQSIYSNDLSLLDNKCAMCIAGLLIIVDKFEKFCVDYEHAIKICSLAIDLCNSTAELKPMAMASTNKLNDLKAKLRTEQQNERKKKIEAYWKEHADEKNRFELRIREIDAEIAQLQRQTREYDTQIDEIQKELQQRIPEEAQLGELKRREFDLINQKSKLGIFSGKQKKALQEQIESMQPQIRNMQESIQRQKKSIQDDVAARVASVKAECKPYHDKIGTLTNERTSIMTELSRER